MKIIADSSALFSPSEGKELGVTVIPACAVINGEIYRDFEDIDSERFLELVNAGGVPSSSQPAIGDVIDVFEQGDGEEILYLAMCDGLSGTYQNAVGAKNSVDENAHIHVMDTETLAGAQHYLVQKALKLKEAGKTMTQIMEDVQESIKSSVSFVIPVDFDFLKRSGRLTPLAAKIGGAIRIVPVMTQTEDRKRIRPFIIKRSKRKAVEAIMEHLKSMKVDENYLISICHGGAWEFAQEVLDLMKQQFSCSFMELKMLSPALITHGGPGCITIQAIKM